VTFVVDASVTLSWYLDDEPNDYADRMLNRLADDSAVVPNIWFLEVANGLLIAERRGRITQADVARVSGTLTGLPISVGDLSLDAALGPIFTLARSHDLSAYDAAYLELAMREGLPLASVDESLRRAARVAGVELAE